MGTVKDLYLEEGIEKMKDLAEDVRICMFCTSSDSLPFTTRPMATSKVDDDGTIWFLSSKDSEKNFEIMENANVQLIYSKPGDSKFMSVYGIASIQTSQAKIDELWNPLAKAWFTEGNEDPNISVIRFIPQTAQYWDTAHGKVISLISIAASALTGKSHDDGIEGHIKL
ncbi:MAG: pyridoxamine 5'-phosphate oxidase family protein [Opitutaceae bacterium]|nr:pyridoxamine 5'-phosphate oxidase family protein [Cytophagales bacterium]